MRARIATRALLAASLVALGGCASVNNNPPAMSPDEEVVEAAPGETEVQVSLENHDITLRPATVEPGPVVFHVYNNGDVNHDFEIRAAGGAELDEEIKFTLDPDNQEDLELDLTPGVYTILCTIDGHQDQGELAKLRVG